MRIQRPGNRKRAALPLPYELAEPPAGARLNLGTVASRVGATVSEMAAASGISRTAIADVMSNRWPARTDSAHIRQALHELLAAKGASEEELRTLFHAHGAGDRMRSVKSPPKDTSRRAAAPTQEDPEMLLPKQSLTPQARRHFKLFTNPFDGEVANESQMFLGDDLAYCREAIWQCGMQSSFMALIGESGAGKTTLVLDLEERFEREARQIIVIRPSVLGMEANDLKGKQIKSTDVLHAIVTRLEAGATVAQTVQGRTTQARKLLTASAEAGNSHLLLLEEAHAMPDATLRHLKRLHELRIGRRPLLGILLVAQPELKQRLAEGLRNGTLREVAQRCEIVELLPLDADLKGYLQRRCATAGPKLEQLLDDQAIEALRSRLTLRRSGGAVSMCYPLAVNNMVTRALNCAADLGIPLVTKDVVAQL